MREGSPGDDSPPLSLWPLLLLPCIRPLSLSLVCRSPVHSPKFHCRCVAVAAAAAAARTRWPSLFTRRCVAVAVVAARTPALALARSLAPPIHSLLLRCVAVAVAVVAAATARTLALACWCQSPRSIAGALPLPPLQPLRLQLQLPLRVRSLVPSFVCIRPVLPSLLAVV
jgi:hypothetical protein